jgi:Transcriptional Coactivator p15 (PC4)
MACNSEGSSAWTCSSANVKNTVEKIRVRLRSYRSNRLIDRRIYSHDDAGEWQPTKTAITLSIERRPELPDALAKSAKALKEQSSCW